MPTNNAKRGPAAPNRLLGWLWNSRHRLAPVLGLVWLGLSNGPVQITPSVPPSHPESTVAHLTGFDASFPQCRTPTAPPGDFGVIGVTGGRPFTMNRCAPREYRWAVSAGAPSLYLNVAFSPSLTRKVTPTCAAGSPAALTRARLRLGWELGCSEASYAVAHAPGPPLRWWLDVETANPWAGTDLRANRVLIEGAVAFLLRYTASPVGVYSLPGHWRIITGPRQWGPVGATADWLGATRTRTRSAAPRACGIGFSGAPIALVQYHARGPFGVYDADYAC